MVLTDKQLVAVNKVRERADDNKVRERADEICRGVDSTDCCGSSSLLLQTNLDSIIDCEDHFLASRSLSRNRM